MSERVAPRGPKPPPIPKLDGQVFEAKKRHRPTPITITDRRKIKWFWVYVAETDNVEGKTFEFTIGAEVLKREYRRKRD